MASKRFDIGNLKGKYQVPNLEYVPVADFDLANELRLHYEIGLGIGLTFLGAAISNPNLYLWTGTAPFLIFGIVSLIRYVLKVKSFRK